MFMANDDTDYLLRSPKNAERLLAALARSKSGVGAAQSIADLKAEVGLADKEDDWADDDLPLAGGSGAR